MATLILEDGTGVEGANTYALLDTVDEYHADRGNALWADASLTDEQKIAFILQGMDYLETRPFLGSKKDPMQSLQFPRINLITRDGILFPDDKVPQAVVDACCLMALAAKQLPPGTTFYATWDKSNRLRREKTDVLEEEYFKADSLEYLVPLPTIDMMLADYIDSPLSSTGKGIQTKKFIRGV